MDGVVTDSQGAPLGGLCVTLSIEVSPNNFDAYVNYTEANGDYAYTNFPAGNYSLKFADCTSPTTYVTQYYSSTIGTTPFKFQSTTFALTAGATVTVNAQMSVASSISGVVDGSSGTPLSGACVDASLVMNPPSVLSGGTFDATATSAADGSYLISGLPAGTYSVAFSYCAPGAIPSSTYYQQSGTLVYDVGAATPVTVGAGAAISGINGVTGPGGTINGQVTNLKGQPLDGICITYQLSGSTFTFARTASDGTYSLGVSAGSHVIFFQGCQGNTKDFAFQFYNESGGRGIASRHATPIDVAFGATVNNVNVHMTLGGEIEGTVKNARGAPVSGVCVAPFGVGAGWLGTVTGPGGTFALKNLPAGSYKLSFSHCDSVSATGRFTPISPTPTTYYYNDTKDSSSLALASLVRVRPGKVTAARIVYRGS